MLRKKIMSKKKTREVIELVKFKITAKEIKAKLREEEWEKRLGALAETKNKNSSKFKSSNKHN